MDWRRILLAFLHDPPDKALDIGGHVARAARYASAALGEEIGPEQLHQPGIPSDQLAAALDRLPLPRHRDETGNLLGDRVVDFLADGGTIHHPLSGLKWRLPLGGTSRDPSLLESETINRISALCSILPEGEAGYHERFMALWRFLPGRWAGLNPVLSHLPADTRVPDHSIWHHNDLVAAFQAALEDGQGSAYLSFAIGPVQGFIEQAKSLRDLWSGSFLLSWLTLQAILAVIDDLPPSVVIFPALRGNPLFDWHLARKYRRAPFEALPSAPQVDAPLTPC